MKSFMGKSKKKKIQANEPDVNVEEESFGGSDNEESRDSNTEESPESSDEGLYMDTQEETSMTTLILQLFNA